MLFSSLLTRLMGLAIVNAKIMQPSAMDRTYQTAVMPMLYPLEEVPMTEDPPIHPAIHRAPSLMLPMERPPR